MNTASFDDATFSQLSEEAKTVFFKMMKRLNLFFMRWNVPFTTFILLDYLDGHREHAEAAEMADELAIPRQTMTALLDSLERQGILMRLPHPQDRRRKIIGMTPKGIDKIQLLKREIRTTEVAAMTDVGLDEIRRLTGLLQKHTDAWDRASKAYNGPITPF